MMDEKIYANWDAEEWALATVGTVVLGVVLGFAWFLTFG